MERITRSSILLLVSLLASAPLARPQSPTPQHPSPSNEAPKPSASNPGDAAFLDARRLLQQGQYDAAISQLEALAAQHPDLKGASRELGIACYKKGDYLKAAEHLRKAREEDPNDNEAIQLLGLSYYLAGRPAEAIPLLEKVQTWYPSANVDAAYILGICYIQTKDYASALHRAHAPPTGFRPRRRS